MLIVRAPVRISFGGGGTDLAAYYQRFGGLVVSAAITRYCHVVVNERSDDLIQISSADYHEWESYPLGSQAPVQQPLALPKAVIAWFAAQGALKRGIDLFLASEVPPGTGLGSSSAMTVALVHALSVLTGRPLEPLELADLACHVEIELLQMPIGKQDQYASACGGLNTIEFTSQGVNVTPLSLNAQSTAALNRRLLLFTTGQVRNSADILAQQRTDTQRQPKTIDALHRIKSLAIDMQQALLAGELDYFGELLDKAWQEKKSLSTKVSSQLIDQCYTAACQAGALGGKITGAGGGGFLLLYCPLRHQQAVREALFPFGLREMKFDIDFPGTQISTSSWQCATQLSSSLSTY
ncbi:MAG: GHMP kinase [Ktedonobacteraceae bacterium]